MSNNPAFVEDTPYVVVGPHGTVMPLLDTGDTFTVPEMLWNICGINRYTGGVDFSVGQHTLLVHSIVPKHLKAQALVHDLHEAIVGDVSTPIKATVDRISNGGWSKFENAVAARVRKKLGLPVQFDPAVHDADVLARSIEVAYLMSGRAKSKYERHGVPMHYAPEKREWFVPRTRKEVFRELTLLLRMEGIA